MLLDPVMWGFICSGEFPPDISYRHISTSLFFTLAVTWVVAPGAFLMALPLARRYGWFWAENPGHVRERAFGSHDWIWESGHGRLGEATAVPDGVPIRVFLFTPFIALVLVMVGATAIVALRSGGGDAARLATKLHEELSANLRMKLDDYLEGSTVSSSAERNAGIVSLLESQSLGSEGRVFIRDESGTMIASSAPDGDAVVKSAVDGLLRHTRQTAPGAPAAEFRFDHITAKPLSRETWLTYATTYRHNQTGRNWTLVTAMPESFYLAGIQRGSSRTAMVFALTLALSLVLAAVLASMVTAPLRRIARATQHMSGGDLTTRAPGSRLEELDALAQAVNDMAGRRKASFDELVGEVETRKRRESDLEESERRLRASEDRVQLAIDAAALGIWDWDVRQDRLVWDESMYRLYGVARDDFTGAFDAWRQCLLPDDEPRATADVAAALRGERPYRSDFRIRRADGRIRTIRGIGQAIRNAGGEAVRLVGVNRDVTELIDAEREREQLVQQLREHQEHLEALVVQRTSELQTAKDAAMDVDRSIEITNTDAVHLTCDGYLVRRVLENLVGNAIHHTPPGSPMWISIANCNSHVRVAVEDEGPGVPLDARARIFEKFGTVEAGHEKTYHSVGLGLAFCKLAIEAQGGTIGVEPRQPTGSCFWFELPS